MYINKYTYALQIVSLTNNTNFEHPIRYTNGANGLTSKCNFGEVHFKYGALFGGGVGWDGEGGGGGGLLYVNQVSEEPNTIVCLGFYEFQSLCMEKKEKVSAFMLFDIVFADAK